jgi:hypothetical protein
MRLYAYTNMYTEGIHAGIQTAHVIGELNTKYADLDTPEGERAHIKLLDWQKNHKTIFIYNGGLASMLWDRYQELREFAYKFELPIARFYESKEALNGALTCVGIVVPDQYYRFSPTQTTPSIGGDLPPILQPEESFRRLLHNCERAR